MLVRVRLLAVFDLAHKRKIISTSESGSCLRSGNNDGVGEGEDGRRYHQYQQKSVGFGNGRHAGCVLLCGEDISVCAFETIDFFVYAKKEGKRK